MIHRAFKIWDTINKSYLMSEKNIELIFGDMWKADEYKMNFLDKGNYTDKPHTVLEIHEYRDGEFHKQIFI